MGKKKNNKHSAIWFMILLTFVLLVAVLFNMKDTLTMKFECVEFSQKEVLGYNNTCRYLLSRDGPVIWSSLSQEKRCYDSRWLLLNSTPIEYNILGECIEYKIVGMKKTFSAS